MPKIFQAPPQHTGTAAPSPLVNPNAESGKHAALAQIGQTLAAIGDRIGQHVTEGHISEERNALTTVESNYQDYVANNPDKPETWEPTREQMFKEYEAGREARKKSWMPGADRRIQLEYKDYRAQADAQARSQATKGRIRKSNASIMAEAEMAARNGYHEKARDAINRLVMDDEAKQKLLSRVLDDGIYWQMDQKIKSMRKVEDLTQFQEDLMKRGEDGNFVTGEMKEGGLSLGGRERLNTLIESKKEQIRYTQTINADRVMTQVESGDMDYRDIDKQVELGRISPSDGEYFKHIIGVQASYQVGKVEEITGDPSTAQEVRDLIGINLMGGKTRKFYQDDEVPFKNYDEAINLIIHADDLSKAAKKDLFRSVLYSRNTYLFDDNQEYKAWWSDRKMSEQEVRMRKQLDNYLSQHIEDFSPATIGMTWKMGEQMIRDAYDNNKDVDYDKLWEKVQGSMGQQRAAAGLYDWTQR